MKKEEVTECLDMRRLEGLRAWIHGASDARTAEERNLDAGRLTGVQE
jgi:hypothetical protein